MLSSQLRSLICLAALLGIGGRGYAQDPAHWVGTWAAAPMPALNKDGKFLPAVPQGNTLRQIVHISLGGPSVRVVLSNEFGLEPLTVGAAQIALSSGGSSINPGSAVALSFAGRSSVTIPPGALMVSDPAAFKAPALANLTVSLFLPDQPVSQVTHHLWADQTNYMAVGNVLTAATLTDAKPFYSWNFLKAIDVSAEPDAAAIVALGDSITDGYKITRDANLRWPDQLARRLQANKTTAKLSVLNVGISGNRLLGGGPNGGPAALDRLDRDVLAQAGVKYLIFLEAINDIGRAYDPKKPVDVVTADDLIASYEQIVVRAHLHGIEVYGATLTPYVGAGYASPQGEKVRQALNAWIRTTHQLDGYIDFDAATRDAARPEVFSSTNDSGDHLHPNDAGAKAMADAIHLQLFSK